MTSCVGRFSRVGAGRGQGWRWGCGQRDPARLPHARPRARPAELITSGIHCCCRRPESRRRRQGGASGGQGGSSLPVPESPVPSPGTQWSPAGSPSPCRGRPGGRRRQSPSGPGKEPDRPSQVSVRGEGEAERAGPCPWRSRIGARKQSKGMSSSAFRSWRVFFILRSASLPSGTGILSHGGLVHYFPRGNGFGTNQ